MKFVISGLVTISTTTQVEAENEDEARAIAAERPAMNLCNGCASRDRDDQWTIEEIDGEIEITTATAVTGKGSRRG